MKRFLKIFVSIWMVSAILALSSSCVPMESLGSDAGNAQTAKPGGIWIDPSNSTTVSGSLHFAVHAYPASSTAPAIDHVNFTVWWPQLGPENGQWKLVSAQKLPKYDDVYEFDWNWEGAPSGNVKISFDVYDKAGGINLAPQGVRSVTYAPNTDPLIDLKITDTNLDILNYLDDHEKKTFPGVVYYAVPKSDPTYYTEFEKLLDSYGQKLVVEFPNYLAPTADNYTQLSHQYSDAGQCVAAVLVLSWTREVFVKDWIKGSNVMNGGANKVKPGTVVATFNVDGKYDGHVAVFKGYLKDGSGFEVWDQNWGFAGVFGKHIITSGSGVNDSNNYYVVQVANVAQTNTTFVATTSSTTSSSISDVTELKVDSTNPQGVKFVAPENGSYEITITGGAWVHLPVTDSNWSIYGGWQSRLVIYKNKPVEWGNPTTWGKQPINFDYELGSDKSYSSQAEAVAANEGASIKILLNKGEYVTALESDEQGYYYDNNGNITIRISRLKITS